MKIWLKRILQLLLGIVIIGGTGWYYWTHRLDNTLVRKSTPKWLPVVKTETVKSMTLEETIESLGTGRARESVDITSTLTEKIVKLNFVDGQEVKRNMLLAQLDDSQLRAEKRRTEINYAEQERELNRVRRLVGKQAAAVKELDEQQTRVEEAAAALDILDVKLRDSYIRAPFDGMLGLRRVSEGDLVSPGTILTTLDDISYLKVDFNVPEKYLAVVDAGQDFQARTIAYPGQVFHGRVLAVATRVDSVTRAVTVRGEIPNPDHRLRPGMLFTVTMPLSSHNIVTIPEKALLSLGEDHYVFVFDRKARTVHRRIITLSNRLHGQVEVAAGVTPGERIVVEGVNKLTDGDKVGLEGAPLQLRGEGGK